MRPEVRHQFLEKHLEGAFEVGQGKRGRKIVLTPASTMTMKAPRWLYSHPTKTHWHSTLHFIPLRALTLVGGREGVGKSTVTYTIAAKLTRGRLRDEFFGKPKAVVICATEDDWESTILPRLTAAGADCGRVFRADVETGDSVPMGLRLPTDIGALSDLCAAQDVGMILLDPLLSTIEEGLDSHKDAEVRRAMEPLTKLAQTSGCAVVGLIHENKSGQGDLMNRLMASRAFGAVVRSVLWCAREVKPGADGYKRFLFGQAKNNLEKRAEMTLRYDFDTVAVGHDEDDGAEIRSSKVVWKGVVPGPIEEVLAEQTKASTVHLYEVAMDWLKAWLPGRGPVPSAVVKSAAEEDGITPSTLLRARQELGGKVIIEPVPGTPKSTWRWVDGDSPTVAEADAAGDDDGDLVDSADETNHTIWDE